MQCYLFEAPSYLFFAPDLPELLYYSHIPTSVIALLVGLYVFTHNPRSLPGRLLLLMSVCFSLWTLNSLVAWTNVNGDLIAFLWPFFGILQALIAILSVYFVYTFAYKRDADVWMKLLFFLLLLPVLLFGHTDLSLSGFNLANCDAFGFEGIFYKSYYTVLGFLAMTWIFALLVKAYRNPRSSDEDKAQLIYIGIGVELFLFMFMFITFIVTYLAGIGYLEDSRLEFYGLFGMTFFMLMLGILMGKFKAFNIRTHAAEILTVTLTILIASQYTYSNSTSTTVILTTITLVLSCLAGIYLIRSVRNEIKQKERNEALAKELARANKRLKKLDQLKSEFVSIASHQLRSPLTSIRGYTSMLLDGSYGKIPEKAKEPISRIEDSSRYMALSIEDYLNVSRIEAGNMKYEMTDFNLVDTASTLVDDLRREAVKRGLALKITTNVQGRGIVHADQGKARQVIHNLIDNAMKYTKKGSINVHVHTKNRPKRIVIDITDTGIGMSEESISELFNKFQRAKNANDVNVTGTGLGLFVAQQMTEGMGGTLTAHSDGEGKGSTFTLTLPLKM